MKNTKRHNSGDEEIRRLLRELKKSPTSEIAEKLAKELKRREDPDPRPEFKCPSCQAMKREPESACVLEALAEVVAARLLDDETIEGDADELYGKVMEWLAGEDAMGLWDDVGPVIDGMEESFRRTLDQSDAEADEDAESDDLDERRETAAQDAFENYDLEGDEVLEVDNWDHDGDVWTLVFYLVNPDGGDSIRATFTVAFRPGTDEVERAGMNQ